MGHRTPLGLNGVLMGPLTPNTAAFPDLKITNGPNSKQPYPTSKRSLVPILKTDSSKRARNGRSSSSDSWRNRPSSRALENQMPNFQNMIFSASDEDLIKAQTPTMAWGNSSPKFASHHALCTNQVAAAVLQNTFLQAVTPLYSPVWSAEPAEFLYSRYEVTCRFLFCTGTFWPVLILYRPLLAGSYFVLAHFGQFSEK